MLKMICTIASFFTFTFPLLSSELKIGLLYTGDSYPIYHAKVKDYFKKHNVSVSIIDFMSAMERDHALQAGAIDGANGDLIGSSLMYNTHQNVQVVALTLGDMHNLRRVGILVSDPKVQSPKDLIGKSVAISPNTIIEYLLDRMLLKAGIEPEKVKTTSVANIPLRLQLLQQKQVTAAVLPEPLASKAVQDGSKILIEDKNSFYSHAVLVFSKHALKTKTAAIKNFMAGMSMSIKEINANPEAFRDEIAKRCKVPQDLKKSFFLYQYSDNKLPSQELFTDVQNWLTSKNKINNKIMYQGLIDERFVKTKSS